MRRFLVALAAALCISGAQSQTIVLVDALPTSSGTISTKYRDGDDGTSGCSTWTCVQVGTGSDLITENSTTSLTFSSNNADDRENYGFAYKSFTNSDVQVCATIPDQADWTGYKENFTGFGVKVSEDLDPPLEFGHVWAVNQNDIPRFKFGTPDLSTSTQGDAATALPEKLCVTFKNSTNEWKGWQSTDGSTYTQIGTTQTYNPSGTLYAGVFGTSQEDGQASIATLTGVTATNTITVDGSAPPPATSTCVAGARTLSDASTISTGLTRTSNLAASNIPCGDTNDIIAGWDFANSPDVAIADRSGVFGTNTIPAYFKGKHLKKCDVDWDEIELSNDNNDPTSINASGFTWTVADACVRSTSGYDGVLVNFRGTVDHIYACGGSPGPADGTSIFLSQWTAPDWTTDDAGDFWNAGCKTKNDGFQIYGIDLTDAADTDGAGPDINIQGEYLEAIKAFAQRYRDDDAWFVMHVQSGSQGEECCGSATDAFMGQIISTWTTAFGAANAYKVAWLQENPTAVTTQALNAGTGIRGGIIEVWKRTVYTPGNVAYTGQQADSLGYLTIDPGFEPISELRHFMDENEECSSGNFGTDAEAKARCYFGSSLRSMQMRRNLMWISSGSAINGYLDDFMSVEMGKTATTTQDAWALLMESRTYANNAIRPMRNLERHLFQREVLGATTSTNKLDDQYNATGNGQLPSTSDAGCTYAGNNHCFATAWSRRGASIGFGVEDGFWSTSLTMDCIFKLTYISSADKTITIKNSAGSTLATISAVGSANVRTATRFVNNCSFPNAGTNKDFSIDSDGTVDFIFVRLIKNGGSFPTW